MFSDSNRSNIIEVKKCASQISSVVDFFTVFETGAMDTFWSVLYLRII